MLTNQLKSHWKTLLLAAFGMGAVIVVTGVLMQWLSGVYAKIFLTASGIVGSVLLFVVVSGLVVLFRIGHQSRTGTNLFQVLNRARSEATIAAGAFDAGLWFRRGWRRVLDGPIFVVGEIIEIKSYDEIVATLDSEGCIEALPFIAEMRRFCGQRARVFRRVDKVYDYGRSKTLRRLDDTFLLTHLRCDGSAHGGCQAGCYLLWKSAWLRRVSQPSTALAAQDPSLERSAPTVIPGDSATIYRCQFTQLAAASTTMSPSDARQDIRPLIAGNLTFAAFCLAMFTRLFNYVQGLRGGIGYPAISNGKSVDPSPAAADLRSGDKVRVRAAEQIAATLDKGSRNRGLWFDKDMLKYCGQSCVVRKRVDRIIDDATGLMRTMKTPCIVLQDVDYSGESLRFAAQEEHLYWREVWLAPVDSSVTRAKSAGKAQA